MWKARPTSALTVTPSLEAKVIDSSAGEPSCGSLVHTMFCTLVGNSTTSSVMGL